MFLARTVWSVFGQATWLTIMSKASILKMLTIMLMYLGLAGVQTEDKRSDAPSAYWAIHTVNQPCHFLDPQAPSFAESLRVHQITDTFHGLSKPKNSDQSDLGFARRKLSPAHPLTRTPPLHHIVTLFFISLFHWENPEWLRWNLQLVKPSRKEERSPGVCISACTYTKTCRMTVVLDKYITYTPCTCTWKCHDMSLILSLQSWEYIVAVMSSGRLQSTQKGSSKHNSCVQVTGAPTVPVHDWMVT